MAFVEKIEEIYKRIVSPQAPQITLSIPLDPESLNRQLQAVSPRMRDDIRIPNYRLTYFVKAGGTVEVPFTLPVGFFCTRRSPLRFESNYYHKDLLVEVKCDGASVNPYSLRLTAPFEIDFGTYYLKRERIDITFKNNTVNDAEVTFQVTAHIISNKIYHDWYEPIINVSYELLKAVAERRVIIIPVPPRVVP